MSKTLPTMIQNNKGGGSGYVYLVAIRGESGDGLGPINIFPFATRAITVTDFCAPYASTYFVGNVLKEDAISPIKQSIDLLRGGNVANSSDVTIKLCNPEYYLGQRFEEYYQSKYFVNRKVDIYLALTQATTVAMSDLLRIYAGKIVHTSYDFKYFTLTLSDRNIDRHKEIPDLTINVEDYPNAPTKNFGKPYPLLYGELFAGLPESSINPLRPCPLIMQHKHARNFVVARNKVSSVNTDHIWVHCQDPDVFLRVDPTSGFDEVAARPHELDMAEPSENLTGWLTASLVGTGTQISPTSLDVTNALDGDPTTSVVLTAGQKLYAFVPIPKGVAEIGDEGKLKVVMEFGAITGNPTNAGKLRYHNPEYDAGAGGTADVGTIIASWANVDVYMPFGADKDAHGREELQEDKDYFWRFDELAVYEFGIEVDASCSIEIKRIYIFLGGLILKGNLETIAGARPHRSRMHVLHGQMGEHTRIENFDGLQSQEAFFSECDGEAFGSWVDDVSRSNDFDEGDLAEYGASIIETLLRSELGLGDDEINVDSFDELISTGNVRFNWRFQGIVRRQRSSREVIREFCKQAAILYFTDYQGKEKAVPFAKYGTPPAAITRATMDEAELKVTHTDASLIYNQFELHHKPDYARDSFLAMTHLDESTHNFTPYGGNARSGTPNTYTGLCAASQADIHITRKLTLELPWVWYNMQAVRFCKWLAEWFCYQKLLVEFESAGLDHLELELGDQRKFNHALIPTALNNSAHFLLYDVGLNPSTNKMKFKFIQLPELLP